MDPFIKLGDDIYVKHELPDSLMIGDVVAIMRDNDIVTHRLVSIRKEGYFCKGDNTYIPDPPVSGEQIFGKVVAIERAGKRIDLDNEYWKIRNRVLGRLGNMENQLYFLGVRLVNSRNKRSENHPHISIGRIVFSPFRAIMRMISR